MNNELKKFDEIINGVNEGLADKWKKHGISPTEDPNIGLMLLDIMKKLDEIESKLPYQRSHDLGPG